MVSSGTESIFVSDVVDGVCLVVITDKAVASLHHVHWSFFSSEVPHTSLLVVGGLVTGQGLKTVGSTIVRVEEVTDDGDFLPEYSDLGLFVAGIAVPQDDRSRGGSDRCSVAVPDEDGG